MSTAPKPKLFPRQSTPFPASAKKVNAWTDGSASTHACKSGGWAFHVRYQGRVIEGAGAETGTTVNAMELTALVKLLERLTPTTHPLQIHSDSEYVIKCLTEHVFNWLGSGFVTSMGLPVKNKGLILRAHKLLNQHQEKRPVAIVWVKGHNGDGGNERCDELAGKARRAIVTLIASPHETPAMPKNRTVSKARKTPAPDVVAARKTGRAAGAGRRRGVVLEQDAPAPEV